MKKTCQCSNEIKIPFSFKITNGRLTIPCMRFAATEEEAKRVALAQHGEGWEVVE